MGISIARGGTEAGSNSIKRPEKRGDTSSAVKGKYRRRVPHVLHKDKFVNQRIVTLKSTENCGSSLKE